MNRKVEVYSHAQDRVWTRASYQVRYEVWRRVWFDVANHIVWPVSRESLWGPGGV
jgi:hypothetical protein